VSTACASSPLVPIINGNCSNNTMGHKLSVNVSNITNSFKKRETL